MCIVFLYVLPSHHIGRVTTIAIKISVNQAGAWLASLIAFCKAYPALEVHPHVCYQNDPFDYLVAAHVHSMVLHEEIRILRKLTPSVTSFLDAVLVDVVEGSLGIRRFISPINTRVRFGCGAVDKNELRENVASDRTVQNKVLPILEGGSESPVAFAREHVEDGF